jgi:hypothetical protein
LRIAVIAGILAALATPGFGQETVLDALNDLNGASAPTVEEVQPVFEALYTQACPRYPDAPVEGPQSFEIRFHYPSDDPSQPKRLVQLYQLQCYAAAYNLIYVFFAWDQDSGLRPVGLSHPLFDVTYTGETDDSPVKAIAITGYAARFMMVNAEYDPKTLTITSGSLWRGLGDASSGGTWVFDDGEFRLSHYELDATFDGEMNPKVVVDFAKPQPVK